MWFDPWPRSVGQGSGIAVNCGVGCRRGSDPMLLWLWCRSEASALIQPLTSYAAKSKIKKKKGVPVMAQWLMNLTRNLPLLSGLTIRRCRELWCRSQTRLRSGVAVAGLWLEAAAPIRTLAWEFPSWRSG